jgi:hypothetical protein
VPLADLIGGWRDWYCDALALRFVNVHISRSLPVALLALIPLLPPGTANAQTPAPTRAARATVVPVAAPPRAPAIRPAPAGDSAAEPVTHFKTKLALGFITSILAHEAGHVIASYAVGGRPYFGFDKGRPTIYSGLDADLEPRKQFIFSSAGLTVQTLMDELILDVPHERGGAFERGILAGGIATTLFYITLGRNASVSDVTFMARTSSLSKTQVSLIFGGIAATHALRIHYDDHYAHFFAAPTERGGLKVGMVVRD